MGQGFMGRAALKYFDRIENVLDSGEKCINDGVDFNPSPDRSITHVGREEKSAQNNSMIPEGSTKSKVQQWNLELLNNLSKEAVAIDDDKYEYLYTGQIKQEEDLQQKMDYVLSQIDSLCKEKFIMPTVTPKVEKYVSTIRDSLTTSQKLAEDTSSTLTAFASQIDTDDH